MYNLDTDYKRRPTTVLGHAREHTKKLLVAFFYRSKGRFFLLFKRQRHFAHLVKDREEVLAVLLFLF